MESRGSGADQVPARALVDPDNGALPRLGPGDRDRRERQPGALKWILGLRCSGTENRVKGVETLGYAAITKPNVEPR